MTKGYTYYGKEIEDVNDGACFAKEVDGRYFVKYSVFGPDTPYFFNHLSPTYNTGDEYKKNNAGVAKFQFKSVSKECFESYLLFLKTTNTAHLRRAQRMEM